MNYFDIFNMPVSLQVDRNELLKKYADLQQKYNPGFATQADPQEQNEAYEKSLLINNAYNTFFNTDETIKYVLQLKGLLQDGEQYNLSADFLIEMKDLDEMLMSDDILVFEEVEAKINYYEKYLYEQIQNIIENYNDEITTGEQLLLVKEYYFKQKYLEGILERLDGIRNIASQN